MVLTIILIKRENKRLRFLRDGVLMYVCICHAVTDKQIRRAVDNGVRTYGELRTQLGVGGCCGRCKSCACQVLDECVADARTTGDNVAGLCTPLAV